MFYIIESETTVQNRNIREWDVLVSTGKTPIYPKLETKNQKENFPKHENVYSTGDKPVVKWVKVKAPKPSKEEIKLLIENYWADYEKQGELVYSE